MNSVLKMTLLFMRSHGSVSAHPSSVWEVTGSFPVGDSVGSVGILCLKIEYKLYFRAPPVKPGYAQNYARLEV